MRAPMPPELLPMPTAAQLHAQDETVRVLERYAREAEAHLASRAIATGERLCTCGIPMSSCSCPLYRDAMRGVEVER